MLYTVIDREHWPRKEYFEHYLHTVPCTYSMTVEIDITSVRQKKLKLYPTILYFFGKNCQRHGAVSHVVSHKRRIGAL